MSTTKIDFSALKLTVMDFNAYSHTDPEIFVNRSGITFSRGVLETLNYPSYVQYLIDPKSHVFAVRACKGNETKEPLNNKPYIPVKHAIQAFFQNTGLIFTQICLFFAG